jgi:hypothetical protein
MLPHDYVYTAKELIKPEGVSLYNDSYAHLLENVEPTLLPGALSRVLSERE